MTTTDGFELFAYFKSFIIARAKCDDFLFKNLQKDKYFNHTNVRVLTLCFGVTDTDIFQKYDSFDDIINKNVIKIIEYYNKNNLMQS